MYKMHKQDDKRKQLCEKSNSNIINAIEDAESQVIKDKFDTNGDINKSPVFGNRFGSSRRNSQKPRQSLGFINTGFTHDDNKMMQEAVDIIGSMPALHLEHCKL